MNIQNQQDFIKSKEDPLPPPIPRIQFKNSPSQFYKDLQKKINDYFSDNNRTPYATKTLYSKSLILIFLWAFSYTIMLSVEMEAPLLIFCQMVFHFTMFSMTIGIAHDGSHNSFSPNPKINRWATGIFDWVGINSYMWGFNHIKSHHMANNVPEYDSAIDSFTLFRFHPRAPYYSIHKYQHLYIVFIYGLSTLFKLFFLDFFSFTRTRIGFLKLDHHPKKEIFYLFITRLTVIFYSLIVPLLWIDTSPWIVLTGFLFGHFFSGLALGMIFQVTHLFQNTIWP